MMHACNIPCHFSMCLPGRYDAVVSGLGASRRDILALLPALGQESYSRAYPHLVQLGMLQEVQVRGAVVSQELGWAQL